MAVAFSSPGVYREAVFPAPKADLPTGVPGFAGFARRITQVGLARLPDGIALPAPLRFDAVGKTLGVAGVLADRLSDALLAQSNDDAFTQALRALHQASRLPPAPVALQKPEEFAACFESHAQGYLADAVAGFFGNGGIRCHVAVADPQAGGDLASALAAAVETLAPLDDLDLVAVPDAMALQKPDGRLDYDGALRVQSAALAHCAQHGNRLAILDALPGSDAAGVLAQRQALSIGQAEPVDGALYYPWLVTDGGRAVPPCGHVVGLIARTDTKRGVFKAPANEDLRGAIDLAAHVDNRAQDGLNPEGVNCLRAFPGRGIRVFGARTLSRDANWCHINVRRLFLTLGRWIDRNMAWASFEANDGRLWLRIQRELDGYLTTLWRLGALQGQTAAESFHIKCDAETNPADVREAGQVVAEIGMAPLRPAEFVIVRIIHRAGG